MTPTLVDGLGLNFLKQAEAQHRIQRKIGDVNFETNPLAHDENTARWDLSGRKTSRK